jgi:hypothetical protein
MPVPLDALTMDALTTAHARIVRLRNNRAAEAALVHERAVGITHGVEAGA